MTKFALVGDVGGTNARLALCDIASGEISRAKTYSGLDYPSLEAVVRVYLDEQAVKVDDGCIAIACPITGDWVAMTNHTWAFSIAEMKRTSDSRIWKSLMILPRCRWRSQCSKPSI